MIDDLKALDAIEAQTQAELAGALARAQALGGKLTLLRELRAGLVAQLAAEAERASIAEAALDATRKQLDAAHKAMDEVSQRGLATVTALVAAVEERDQEIDWLRRLDWLTVETYRAMRDAYTEAIGIEEENQRIRAVALRAIVTRNEPANDDAPATAHPA